MSGIFNGAVRSAALAALYELGLLDELERQGQVDVREFCRQHDLHPMSVEGLLKSLEGCHIFDRLNGGYHLHSGPEFAAAFANKGYFLWLTRGYGDMLSHLADLCRLDERHGDFIKRDGRYIALAGRDYGARFVDEIFLETFYCRPSAVVADLGCGSGERLIRLLKLDPTLRGLGVDISPGAVEVARAAVAQAGLDERMTVMLGDIRSLPRDAAFESVDTLCSFFMAHDLWPRESCQRVLDHLSVVFPGAQRFLLCDTYRDTGMEAAEPPIFTLGFELTHAIMGQYIPTLEEWRALLAESNWQLSEVISVGINSSSIFDLSRRGT